MNSVIRRCVAVLALAVGFGAAPSSRPAPDRAAATVVNLRCEFPFNEPAGIDVPETRDSVIAPASGIQSQLAYRVLVASSLASLSKDVGDLWDSGRVASGESTWTGTAAGSWIRGSASIGRCGIWGNGAAASPWSPAGHVVDGACSSRRIGMRNGSANGAPTAQLKTRRFGSPG